jgi:hypothetical protein
MQQTLHLENVTDPADRQDQRIALGKGLVLALENGLKGEYKKDKSPIWRSPQRLSSESPQLFMLFSPKSCPVLPS